MDLGISGRRALVLGSSQGLGAACADALAAEGVAVTLCGRNIASLEPAADRLRSQGATASCLAVDLAEPSSVAAFLTAIGPAGDSPFDILVNNGGGPPPMPILSVPAAEWDRGIQSLMRSIFTITAHVVPAMRIRHWGRVINIVSSGVDQPIPNLGLSNTLRASVIGWAKTLATEVGADGVTVNSVLPGRIQTARVDALDSKAAAMTGRSVDDIVAAARHSIPLGRYGTPQEFGDVVAFLASERARYITGSKIRVDGGMIRSI